MGGVARRATYFFDVHASESPRLLVSGGWEFMRPNGAQSSLDFLDTLAKAYDFMKYDVALLGQTEADLFSETGATPDSARKTAAAEPVSMVKLKSGKTIAFVRYPSTLPGKDIPSERLIERVSKTIKSIRSSVDLVVGMSDWGWVGEREYLAMNPSIMPDILLGSGLGSGVDGRVEADGRCIWIRPYDKGRTVSELRIMNWPDRSNPFAWQEPDNFQSMSTALGDKYSDHPDVNAILD